MDSNTALKMPEYLPSPFPGSPRLYHGTSHGCSSLVAAVLTATVLASGLIAAAIIFQSGGYPVTMCPAVGNQVAQPMTLSGNKVKRADLTNEKGDHLTEAFDYDRQSNTILIDSPANITESSSAATIAVDINRSVMFVSFHDSNTCIGFAIEDDFAHRVRDYVEENGQNEIDISSVAFNIKKYRLAGQIPAAYFEDTNGPVIRALCAGRNTFWALRVTAEEHDRLRRGTCSMFCICNARGCDCERSCDCCDRRPPVIRA